MIKELEPQEINFYKPLIREYLRCGSVDLVFKNATYNTGVSYPHFHRILDHWGIVKSAGPNSRLSEAVFFLGALVRDRLPLEAIYRLLPHKLQVSKATLHRIADSVRKGLARRQGTALLISFDHRPEEVVIGSDHSVPRPELGKNFGDLSLPMTYSKRGETIKTKITRVLQQEVFSGLAIDQEDFLSQIDTNQPIFFKIRIADVMVDVIRLVLPKNLSSKMSSFKLEQLHLEPLSEIALAHPLSSHYRAGVPEIASLSLSSDTVQDQIYSSELNRQVALLAAEAIG